MWIDRLKQSVQYNCDISDQAHAADYTICVYLMRMREYFRWAKQLDWTDSLDQSELMDWITSKEAAWQGLEQAQLKPVDVLGQQIDCFDQQGINALIQDQGLIYQAGFGRFGKPVFVLAEIKDIEKRDEYQIIKTGRELARELASPPAYVQGKQIIIRYHALSRLIWDLVEEWQWNKPDNAMSEVVKLYDFESHPIEALSAATEEQAETLVLHEIGELLSGQLLDSGWNDWLSDLQGANTENYARAVRDYLADCLTTLPSLLALENHAGLHFYFANLTPLRKSMFPSLVQAYQSWRNGGRTASIKTCVRQGQSHWLNLANQLCDHQTILTPVNELIETHAL